MGHCSVSVACQVLDGAKYHGARLEQHVLFSLFNWGAIAQVVQQADCSSATDRAGWPSGLFHENLLQNRMAGPSHAVSRTIPSSQK